MAHGNSIRSAEYGPKSAKQGARRPPDARPSRLVLRGEHLQSFALAAAAKLINASEKLADATCVAEEAEADLATVPEGVGEELGVD